MKKYIITFFIAISLMFLLFSWNKNEREKNLSTIRDLNPEIEKKSRFSFKSDAYK